MSACVRVLHVLALCRQWLLLPAGLITRTPDVIDVRVRSDADPTPCPFFCCAAVLSFSTCSSFALAW